MKPNKSEGNDTNPLNALVKKVLASASILGAKAEADGVIVGARFPDTTEEMVLLVQEGEKIVATLPVPEGRTDGYVVGSASNIDRVDLASMGLLAHELVAAVKEPTEKRAGNPGPRGLPTRYLALLSYAQETLGAQGSVKLEAIHGDGFLVSVGAEKVRLDLSRSGNLALRVRDGEGTKVLAISKGGTDPDVLGIPPEEKGGAWSNLRLTRSGFETVTL